MFCRRLLVLLVLVAGFLAATAEAQPSRRDVSRRVSECSNKLNRFGTRPARLFCIAYLNGRQPATPKTTLTTTRTTTLAAITTTVPATVTSTQTTTVSETTTATLSTQTVTTKTDTTTTTPTGTNSVTATETTTITVPDPSLELRGRSALPTGINPVPLGEDDESPLDKRSVLTSSQAASIFGSYIASEITEACLLIVYGRTSNPTQKVTSTVTATSTPAPLTASSTTTHAVTDTTTNTLTETVTTTTATLTETSTATTEAPTETVTTTVTTVTVTSTSTVAPAPTTTSGILKAGVADGLEQYVTTESDTLGSGSRLLRLVSNANLASRVTYDPNTRRLLLAGDPTFKSSTIDTDTAYYFRMTQDNTTPTQRIITCSVAVGTRLLTCATTEGYTVLQSCGGDLVIADALYCDALGLQLE
ncbi:hypothetical protein PHBOTO_006528 [Pseudozyma hubeiensis]|nr:hypothetical protein PHBOTO_006528 [Pseudozyma hubeiensis]